MNICDYLTNGNNVYKIHKMLRARFCAQTLNPKTILRYSTYERTLKWYNFSYLCCQTWIQNSRCTRSEVKLVNKQIETKGNNVLAMPTGLVALTDFFCAKFILIFDRIVARCGT